MTRASGIAGAFVVALALAPISAQGQQIFACVNNSSGTIHIVAQNALCASNEISLVWNVAGPQGPAGPAGQSPAASRRSSSRSNDPPGAANLGILHRHNAHRAGANDDHIISNLNLGPLLDEVMGGHDQLGHPGVQ